jgi:hypothetical protein
MTALQYAENFQIGTLCTSRGHGRVTRSNPVPLKAGEYINREMMCSIVDHILDPEIKYIMTFGGTVGVNFCDKFYLFDTQTYTWTRAKTRCPDLGIAMERGELAATLAGEYIMVASAERVTHMDAMKLISETPQPVSGYTIIAKSDEMTIPRNPSMVAVPFESSLLLMDVNHTQGGTAVAVPRNNQWVVKKIPEKYRIPWASNCTAISDECVLITGGWHNELEHSMSTCVLYNARTHTFTDMPPMTRGRSGHAACLLLNGDVFVCGGSRTQDDDHDLPIAGAFIHLYPFAEIFNHKTRTWSNILCALRPRRGHECIPISETKVLILGGQTSYYISDKTNACEVYDFATNTAVLVAEIPERLWGFTVVPLYELPPTKETQHDID